MKEKPSLDFLSGLRGIAVLLVLGRHAFEYGLLGEGVALPNLLFFLPPAVLHTGSVGVTLFFFVSGFVLFYPYALHAFEQYPAPTLSHYIERRIAKIVPSYWFALCCMALFIPLNMSPFESVFSSFVKHVFFLHSFWAASQASIAGPFWTLPVEVQFYVIFPIIARCLIKFPILTMLSLIGIHTVYKIFIYHICPGYDSLSGYYGILAHQLPTYIDIFGFGSLCAYLIVRSRAESWKRFNAIPWKSVAWLSAIALWSILGYENTLLLSEGRSYSVSYAHWLDTEGDTIAALLVPLCIGVSKGTSLLRNLLETPLLLWIADISYNLYLWNWTILYWYRAHIASTFAAIPYGDTINTLLALGMAFAVAWVLTQYIEKPILRNSHLLWKKVQLKGSA